MLEYYSIEEEEFLIKFLRRRKNNLNETNEFKIKDYCKISMSNQ